MSIKIDWPVMSSVPDSLTLYWSATPFTPDTLPVDKVVLSPSAVTYTDTSVPNRTYRYYMLEAKKAGANPQYSQCMIHGNWNKTGPGPQTIRRGDWKAGYFGLVPVTELFTVSGLAAAAGASSLGVISDSISMGWHKFVVNGKILFFPTRTLTSSSVPWSKLYNLGLVYGVDSPGEAPFDLTTIKGYGASIPDVVLTNQKKVVTVGTDSFLVRLPKIASLPTNQYFPTGEAGRDYIKDSEWCQTLANMAQAGIKESDLPLVSPNKWGDLAGSLGLIMTPHFTGAKISAYLLSDPADWLRYTGAAPEALLAWFPVLEYIPE